MKLYLVDRLSSYYPGYEVKLQKIIYQEVNEMTILLENLFPHGLSRHGIEHFLNKNAHITIKEVSIEWAAEFYRRAMCPNKPSRMTSIFACGTIEDAKRFRMDFGDHSNNIYEITVDDDSVIHCGDMNLLNNNCNSVSFTYWMNAYWSSQKGDNAFYEYLIPLPVQIGNKVN